MGALGVGMAKKQTITCDDCGTNFEVKWQDEQEELCYCPFCGADLFWEEDEDEEESDLSDWDDPDNDEYE